VPASADACPSCASALIHPLRWSEDVVAFRCPECLSCFRAACTPAELEAIEARQAAGRAALVASYERAVVATLEAPLRTPEAP
jgi:hypothetical protein